MPHIVIDSSERSTGTAENYTFRLFAPLKDIRSIRLVSAQVPKTMLGIVAGFNDAFNLDGNTIIIDEGSYSGADLAVIIQGSTQALGGIYAADQWEYNAQLNRLEYSHLGAGTVIVSNSATGVVPKRVDTTYGFIPGQTVSAPSGVATPMPNQVDMSFPRQLYLNIAVQQWEGQDVWTDRNSHSFVIPMSGVNFGEVEVWTAQSFYHQQTHAPNVNAQEFRINWRTVDPNYPLDFHGVDHQLILEILTIND